MRPSKFLIAFAAALLGAAALAVPLPPAPREKPEEPPAPGQYRKAANNLKQIGLAMHNYHDANNAFPGDVTDKDGKPLLSWRVQLLPYFGLDDLYNQVRLDEPWDSEHNKKLLAKVPEFYAPLRGKAQEGQTFYQMFTGKDALLPPAGKANHRLGRRITAITDGTSNTFMVVEAGDPVHWAKPGDLPFDPKKPLPKLGGMFPEHFHVVFCDGSVRKVSKKADPETLKKLITPSGGEPVGGDALE